MNKTLKLQKGALCFSDQGSFAKADTPAEGKERSLKMTAYSGKLIKDHWYWGDLVIDTSGVQLSAKDVPILEDHQTSRKIGFGKFAVDNHAIVAERSSFVETPYAEEFLKLSDQGFPYQASIRAVPTKIQRLEEKEEVEVNGFKMRGPGTVWRESVLKECSIVTFGADPNTKSVAMTEEEDIAVEFLEEMERSTKHEEVNMDLTKLKAEHPDLFAEIVAFGKQEAETAFASEKAVFEAKIQELSSEKDQLTAANKDVGDRILALEKDNTLRREKEIKMSADAVFNEKLKGSGIPERLFGKIRKQIDHESFVKDDRLDVEAFSAAIDTELKDWVPEEGGSDASVMGMGFTKSSASSGDDVDKMVDRMLGHVGQESKH